MNQLEIPYECHVMVCMNDRGGARKSCADGESPAIRARLKEEVKARWPKSRVRVSQTLCLGLCSEGPNVVIYPQNIWFSGVTLEDVETIVQKVEELLR